MTIPVGDGAVLVLVCLAFLHGDDFYAPLASHRRLMAALRSLSWLPDTMAMPASAARWR